jgi:hypothetical protein
VTLQIADLATFQMETEIFEINSQEEWNREYDSSHPTRLDTRQSCVDVPKDG